MGENCRWSVVGEVIGGGRADRPPGVALGRPYWVRSAFRGALRPPGGRRSVAGRSGGDAGWGGALVVSCVVVHGDGVAAGGPCEEVEQLAVSADGVGSFAQHRVVEQPVAGFGVVAATVEAWVVGIVGWDGAEVFFAVEPGEAVFGGLVEPEPDGGAAEVVGEPVFAVEPPAVAVGSSGKFGSGQGVEDGCAVDGEGAGVGCTVDGVQLDGCCGGHGGVSGCPGEVVIGCVAAGCFVDLGDRDDPVAGDEVAEVGAAQGAVVDDRLCAGQERQDAVEGVNGGGGFAAVTFDRGRCRG